MPLRKAKAGNFFGMLGWGRIGGRVLIEEYEVEEKNKKKQDEVEERKKRGRAGKINREIGK